MQLSSVGIDVHLQAVQKPLLQESCRYKKKKKNIRGARFPLLTTTTTTTTKTNGWRLTWLEWKRLKRDHNSLDYRSQKRWLMAVSFCCVQVTEPLNLFHFTLNKEKNAVISWGKREKLCKSRYHRHHHPHHHRRHHQLIGVWVFRTNKFVVPETQH